MSNLRTNTSPSGFMSGAAKTSHATIGAEVDYRLSEIIDSGFPEKANFRRGIYGQDSTIVVDECPGVMGPDEHLFAELDGHGDRGETWSQLAGTLLCQQVLASWRKIKTTLRRGAYPIHHRQAQVERLLKALFRRVEQSCMQLRPHLTHSGGATATVSIVMIVRSRRWVIQAAVGDSPGYLATLSSGGVDEVIQGPTEANGDNVRSVTEYVVRHQREEQWPKPVIFSRINAAPHAPRIQTGVSQYGTPLYNPLPAWRFFDNEKGMRSLADAVINVRPHMENYGILEEQGHYIGTQSLNLPPYELSGDGTRYVLSNRERDAAANWGCSVDGQGQNTTAIGDIAAGLAADCDASVHFYTEEQSHSSCLVFSHSDGMGDVKTSESWAKSYLEMTQNPTLMADGKKLFNWLRLTTELAIPDHYRPNFNWKLRHNCLGEKTTHPSWDDVSTVGIVLPPWTGSRRRRRCIRGRR